MSRRVVVIVEASREANWTAIRGVIEGLSFKPGDGLKLLSVFHQVNNPMGYKISLDSKSMFGANKKVIAEELAMKKEEYRNSDDINHISTFCQSQQIGFDLEVRAEPSPNEIAVEAVKKFKATLVILDRHLKRDSKYFMKMLSCDISRFKTNGSTEHLRVSKPRDNKPHVTYDEMIPESPSQNISSTQSLKSNLGDEQGCKHRKSSSSELMTTATTTTNTAMNSEASSSSEMKLSPLQDYPRLGDESSFCIAESPENGVGGPDHEEISSGDQNDDHVFDNSICSICKNRRPNIGLKKDFSYIELYKATEAFNPKNYLSEGGFGSVFRGEINKLKIAVKQHKNASFQGEKEFKSEVNVLSKARHPNLVMLLGSCSEGNHRLLVYEFVCHGSLDQHLSKHTRRPLSWEKRMKIALGAAKGLQYLHENKIIHRDMRPNNILVTHDYETMLGDFGLARTHSGDMDHSTETGVVGTLGYMAPEYAECGRVSTKTDVYSFGVVLLQLITGLKTTDKSLGGKSLVGWARPLLKERNYPDLVDPRILESHDVHQLFWMVQLAVKCLSKEPRKRLPMKTVVDILTYIIEGSAGCNIGGFSPTESDSISYSIAESSGSHGDGDDGEDQSPRVQSEMKVLPLAPIHPFQRLPPSPSLPPSSALRAIRKKAEASRGGRGLLYDEMVS